MIVTGSVHSYNVISIFQGMFCYEMLGKMSLVGFCAAVWCILFSIHIASCKQLNVVWSVNAGGEKHVDSAGIR